MELQESSLILSEVLKISGGDFTDALRSNSNLLELEKNRKVASRLKKLSKSYNDISFTQSTDRPLRTINTDATVNQNITKFTAKIKELSKEIEIKNSKIIEQQRCLSMLEEALRESNSLAELDQLLAVVRSKDERISELEQMLNKGSKEIVSDYKNRRIVELEEALKESFVVATEREKVFYQEEQRRIETLRRMRKLEQRLLSLQNASALRCQTCSLALGKLRRYENSVSKQQELMQQLTQTSLQLQKILEGCISEKDARIAELEEHEANTELEASLLEQLRRDRAELVDKLKQENELAANRVGLLSTADAVQHDDSPPDLTLADQLLGLDTDDLEDTLETVL